jgi:glycogen debranching enzyme
MQILNEIFETAVHFHMRLPEFYCGFARILSQGPAPSPVACLPQAWASGAAFLLLQACLGIHIDGERKDVHVLRPVLPPDVGTLCVRDLSIGTALIGLESRDRVVVSPMKHAENGVSVLGHL